MPSDPTAAAPDARLAEYLSTPDSERARQELGELLAGLASPLVWKILHRQLGGASGAARAVLEDLHGDLLLKLQLQLESARLGEREPPASFLDYVAVAAYNAASSYQMARQPERTRLRDRVRYVLRREDRLGSWNGPDRVALCGLAGFRDSGALPDAAGRLAELARLEVTRSGSGWGTLPKQVVRVLERLGGPCELEALVDAFASATGVDDGVLTLTDEERGLDGENPRPSAPVPATAQATLEARERLAAVWLEIMELPKNQRVAILLNLRGEGGEAMLEELLATPVVDLAGLARSLDLAEPELAALLPRLPLDDAWIAERLGLDRSQVANLRKSGRLRLARRLRHLLA